MSQLLTFDSTATATIYGSLAGALGYLSSRYDGWDSVATDEALWKLLVRATSLVDRLSWVAAADTFAERDAIDLGTGSGDAAFPFRAAVYEWARLARTNPALLSLEQGSNVASISDGGASVSYFGPSSAKALPMPRDVMDLIGGYLDSGEADLDTPASSTGAEVADSPFATDANFERTEPY
jgi:hypothetical protein